MAPEDGRAVPTERVRAAEATEAIAVEVFRQCECSGQPVSMAVIERALIASAVVLVWAVRRDGRECESRPRVSDGVDLAAVGGGVTRTDRTLGQRAHAGSAWRSVGGHGRQGRRAKDSPCRVAAGEPRDLSGDPRRRRHVAVVLTVSVGIDGFIERGTAAHGRELSLGDPCGRT